MKRKHLKKSILYGTGYAIGMSAFHYLKNGEFSIWDFLFYLLFFGTCMWLTVFNRS